MTARVISKILDRRHHEPIKPITELNTKVVRSDGTVVLDGTAVCYTMPLPS